MWSRTVVIPRRSGKVRFFAGLSLPQAAAVLRISPTTADRHWAYARAWLYNELRREE